MKKGTFSSLATLGMITWAAINFAGFEEAIPMLKTFFSGGAIAIQEDSRKTISDLLPICAAIIPMDFVVSNITTIVVAVLLGSAPESAEKTLRLSKLWVVAKIHGTQFADSIPKAAPGHS